MNRSTASIVASSFIVLASAANAAPLTYAVADTRAAGSATVVNASNDGDGSYQLETYDATSFGKASILFFSGPTYTAAPLGTLGNLTSFTAEYFKASTPAPNGNNTTESQFAYRLWTNPGGTQSLVWENQYNTNATVPTDAWQSLSMAGGKFWQRTNSTNYNNAAQEHPLSYYIAGNTEAPSAFALSASTPIYGIEIAYGSGVGAFSGNVDNINATFNDGVTTTSFNGNVVAVPEPTTVTILGLVGAGLMARRRRPIA